MSQNKLFRVLRDGKPVEDTIYSTYSDAEARAHALREMLKRWDPKDVKKVSIVPFKPRKK